MWCTTLAAFKLTVNAEKVKSSTTLRQVEKERLLEIHRLGDRLHQSFCVLCAREGCSECWTNTDEVQSVSKRVSNCYMRLCVFMAG